MLHRARPHWCEAGAERAQLRYPGRIRFDDVDGGDLDAAVEVTDSHVRFMSGNESLGSWCLADVVANRVVANEFEIDLEDEVVKFLADDQVNFAYGAVQAMAEGWARYHSMNLLRRKRAVSAARRQNEPSRLQDARRAFVMAEETLEATFATSDEESWRDDPVESLVEDEAPATGVVEAPYSATGPPDVTEPPSTTSPAAAGTVEDEKPTPARPDTRPVIAGRLPRLDALPTNRSSATSSRRARRRAGESEETESDPSRDDGGAPPPQPEPASGPEPEVEPESNVEEALPPSEVVPVPDAPPAAETLDEPEPPPASDAEGAIEPDGQVTETESNGHRRRRRRETASLGAFGDGHHPAETSGLRASMRSLFARSPGEHEHTFVESTTAVGLTRRVCLECGHVSIGVSE